MYLGRGFQGFGEACLYIGAAAWTVELAGLDRSARGLGYLSSGIWGGISSGPVIGHWLGTFERAAAFQSIAAIAAIALLMSIEETYRAPHEHEKRPWIRPFLLPAGFAVGFVNVHYPVITGFLILHLANHGNSGPAAFSTYAGLVLLSRFFLGGLPDRISPRVTYYGGLASMAVGLTLLAIGPPPPIALLAAALLGFGFSFPWASIASTVLRRIPSHERGSSVSVLSAFYDLFVGISSFSAGLIANRFGYSAAFAMAALALVVAAIAGRGVFANVDEGVEIAEPTSPSVARQ
jgi:MFS family permease